MIGHTRDIIDGKGEYALAYTLLSVWEKHYPDLAVFAFRHFLLSDEGDHPYGSWKDVKCYSIYGSQTSAVLHSGIFLINEQLRKDLVSDTPSLAARWVPREKSKYGELFERMATYYFVDYIISAKTPEAVRRATLKAKTEYRKLISGLNRRLDTVQIKQCSNQWSEIDFEKGVTSITMHKQKKAFLNLTKNGKQRSSDNDRIECANKMTSYIERAVKGDVEVKGKRIGLDDMVKNAMQLRGQENAETQLLNLQWDDNAKQTAALGKIIPMCDVSGSMWGGPFEAAIGLSIRCAEKSVIGNRVLTFSAQPEWVNLDGAKDLNGVMSFVEKVYKLSKTYSGLNTNFNAALTMILDAIVKKKLSPDDVEDMVLAIFSDMQIDCADDKANSMYELIETKYAAAGTRLWGKPFKVPHILFWNLRSTGGFPTLSTQRNASMMSGFSPALLNLFCEEGVDALQSCTPWSLFEMMLKNKRYDVLGNRCRDEFLNI